MAKAKGRRKECSNKDIDDRVLVEISTRSDNRLGMHGRWLQTVIALALIVFLIPLMYPSGLEIVRSEIDDDGIDSAHRYVQDFLNNFVCQHKPSGDVISKVDIPGYCHPKLQSAPLNRTQLISYSQNSPSTTLFSLKRTIYWWRDALYNTNGVAAGEHLMTLPRPLQIWDLDALRDKFIQQHFLGYSQDGSSDHIQEHIALHKETKNPLDSGAYLAVYLLRLLQGSLMRQEVESGNNCRAETNECAPKDSQDAALDQWTDLEQHSERIDLLRDYLKILPTYGDRIADSNTGEGNIHEHPITWNKQMLESLFPKYTHTYNLIVSYQTMVHSEYNALKATSPEEFGANVNYTQYIGMRINVLSRAFSAITHEHDSGTAWKIIDSKPRSLSNELMSYTTSNFGAASKQASEFKFRSMCPLLDMYNSHPNPNVIWRYDPFTSSYTIHANNKPIPRNHEIIVSYGFYTDGHLFAKYGYVNGDGSSKSEVSLNVFHRMLGDVGLSWQFSPLPFHLWDHKYENVGVHTNSKQSLDMQSKELLRYLMFDDGHKECIQFTNNHNLLTKQQELKFLKFQHLKRLANLFNTWIVRLPARFPNAQPSPDGSLVQENESRVGIDAKRILSICRLLSLTVDDVGGEAIEYLQSGLSDDHFQVEMHGSALEYRSLMCVVRLSDVAFRRYGQYSQPSGNLEPKHHRNSREWSAWYIRDGEMRLLSILRQTAMNEANKIKHENQLKGDNIYMRERPCLIEHSLPILQLEHIISST
jgi:hypothetical protein